MPSPDVPSPDVPSTEQPALAIRTDRPSPNHGARAAPGVVDMLILHYTGMQSGVAALERLTDPASQVSAHYLVDEDATIWRLVAEDRRAWHAGKAAWTDVRDVNSHSIGIEIVNPGHEFGYRPFPDGQMRAVRALCRDILARHPIPPGNVLGHSDVAPDRKQDPGELFDWRGLAADGIGLWPRDGQAYPPPAEDLGTLLARLGYDLTLSSYADVLTAWQRHWHPEALGHEAGEETVRRVLDLLAQSDR